MQRSQYARRRPPGRSGSATLGLPFASEEKHCDPDDPDDAQQGDNWDRVALDAEHRLVVSVVPGKWTAEKVEALVEDFKERTGGRPMNLITSDEYTPASGL